MFAAWYLLHNEPPLVSAPSQERLSREKCIRPGVRYMVQLPMEGVVHRMSRLCEESTLVCREASKKQKQSK
jgi:hypothetical protein